MIVRYTAEGWEIITQRNHGLLAAEICARWKLSKQPKRWVETLLACAGHDDAYNELQNGPLLTASGGPMNFDMNRFDETLTTLLINMAITKSSFTALLTAKHIAFTHGQEPAARSFLRGLKSKEKQWLKAAETTVKEVNQAYELLEFCDAFSLLICQGIIQPEARKMEISTGPDGKIYSVYDTGEALVVNPWPFEVPKFEVSYEIRRLQQIAFENDEEFRQQLYQAAPRKINLWISKE